MDAGHALGAILLLTMIPLALATDGTGKSTGVCIPLLQMSRNLSDLVVQAVYGSDGYHPFKELQVKPKETTKVERKEMILTDPSTGTALDVTLSDSATSPSQTLLGNAYAEGPFAVSLIISDTLRLAYPDGYADGPYLRERFEGRYEKPLSAEALGTIAEGVYKVAISPIYGIKAILESREPIKNKVSGDSIEAEIVCASVSCHRELYSLLTKLMNLGASGEMVVEMGMSTVGNALLLRLGSSKEIISKAVGFPGALRRKIVAQLKSGVPGGGTLGKFLETVRKIGSNLRLKALSVYDTLPDTDKSIIQEMLVNPSEADVLMTKLTPEGRRVVYSFFETLSEVAEKVRNGKPLDKVDEEIIRFFIAKAKKETQSGIYEPLEQLRPLLGNDPISEEKKEEILRTLNDYVAMSDRLKIYVPLLASQYDYVKHTVYSLTSVEGARPQKLGAVLGKFVLTPLGFYLVRNFPALTGRPMYSKNTQESLLHIFPLKSAYSLPSEWTEIRLDPLEDRDMVIDVLVNNGSDPGDLFKSVLSTVGGIGALSLFLTSITGQKDLPFLDAFVVTAEEERRHQMKPAIVALAVPSSCTECRLVQSEDTVAVSAPAELFLALTENSRKDEGSTIITFFRKANLSVEDEKVLDMKDTKNSCAKKCLFLKSNIPGINNPAAGMFTASLFIGYVVPFWAGGWGSMILAYPVVSYFVYSGCFNCVDTTLGYYLHVRAPPEKEEEHSLMETNFSKSLLGSLRALGLDVDLNKVLMSMEKRKIEKGQTMFYAKVGNAQGILVGKVVSEWVRPRETLPIGKREGKLVLVGKDRNITVDGSTVSDGDNTVSARGAEFAVPDTTIPAVIFPAKIIFSKPTNNEIIFTASSSKDFSLNPEVINCLRENGIEPGKLKAVVTDEGSVFFDERGFTVQAEKWSGRIEKGTGKLTVRQDFSVTVTDSDLGFESDKILAKSVEKDIGDLKAIVMDNLTIMRVGSALYIWERVEGSVNKKAVGSATLLGLNDKAIIRINPSPNATSEEESTIDKINKRLVTGEVKAIEGTRYAVAIVEDPKTGKKYLRIYDKEKNTVTDEEIVSISQDPNDPTALKITTTTKDGKTNTHTVKVEVAADGTPVLKVDGKDGGIVKTIQTPDGFLYFNPETGEWQLINGVLAPLAEAFKKGIKLTFEGGVGVGRPSGGIVINTGPRQRPFSLPLLEGWQLLPLVLGALLVFVVTRRYVPPTG